MSVDDVLNVGSLLLPAVVVWWLRVHLRETERERQQAVRRQTEVLRRLAKIICPFLLSMCYDWLYAEPNK